MAKLSETTPDAILERYWGHTSFRPLQLEVVNSILAGNDTLALLPTGGGKSLCYQLPALMLDGLCLVISPLIALMQDQLQHLEKMGIPAAAIYSGMTYQQTSRVLREAQCGAYKLLFVSPERLQSYTFRQALEEIAVSFFAIDEAHCISQWGHDFRPAYLKIASLREIFPKIPVLALTATATQPVQEDIARLLRLTGNALFKGSFRKPNLRYEVLYSDDRMKATIEAITATKGTCLVYCRSRRQTEIIAGNLADAGIAASAYHAGLSKEKRSITQRAWMRDETRVMVATTAFGMGIDKGDVNLVVHFDMPEHLEAYYQEAGRAGRAGQPSRALCLYNAAGIRSLRESVAIRFPSDAYLRLVYQSVCEFLAIAIGTEPDQYFSFSLEIFCQRFQLKPLEAVHALRLLEQHGMWTMSDAVYSAPCVQFKANRYTLDDLVQRYAAYGAVILSLLRLYGSVFQSSTPIRLQAVAKHCRMKTEEIVRLLQELDSMGILTYQPAKEGPQLYFHHYRVDSNHLHLNHDYMHSLRLRCESQIVAMIAYLQTGNCRERALLQYFGAYSGERCNHCDRCDPTQTATDIEQLRSQILSLLKEKGNYSLTHFADHFTDVDRTVWTQIIRQMLDEGVLSRDSKGMLYTS